MKYILPFMFIAVLLSAGFAAAADDGHVWHWYCAARGEGIPTYDDYVCEGWCCIYCVNEEWSINPNKCNLADQCSCGGGGPPDVLPPNMTIITPTEGGVYSSRAIAVHVDMTGESASLHVKNNNKVGASYYRVCDRSSSCERTITVDEGLNSWSFMAKDYFGNYVEEIRTFTVDSKPPVIRDVWPEAGAFASRTFGILYDEEGLRSVELYYKDSKATSFTKLTGTCPSGRNQQCEIQVTGNIAQGAFEYYFCIKDVVNEVCSTHVTVSVDTEPQTLHVTAPANDAIYPSRAVLFQIQTVGIVTLSYIDVTDAVPRERLLCSGCEAYSRTQSFTDGPHEITIIATDNAGNPAQVQRTFRVDSVAPKIITTSPKALAYGKGEFSVVYTEANLKQVTLYYKQGSASEYTPKVLTGCESGLARTCAATVAVLAQGKLTYYFQVKDIADVTAESKPTDITIDNQAPVLTVNSPVGQLLAAAGGNPTFVYSTRRIQFDLSAVDNNDIKFEVMDHNDAVPRWRQLSNRGQTYNQLQTYVDGQHQLTIRATDPAGNTDEENRIFIVDSVAPRITRSLPRNGGFGNGVFTAFYNEQNPTTLTLLYRYVGESVWNEVPKAGCPSGMAASCDIAVPGIADGSVQFKFRLADIAGSEFTQTVISTVKIDTKAPELTVSSPVAKTYSTRYIQFTMTSDEPVTFEYRNYNVPVEMQQWKRLAFRVNSYDRSLGFNLGDYDIQIRATDDAGNIDLSDHIIFKVV